MNICIYGRLHFLCEPGGRGRTEGARADGRVRARGRGVASPGRRHGLRKKPCRSGALCFVGGTRSPVVLHPCVCVRVCGRRPPPARPPPEMPKIKIMARGKSRRRAADLHAVTRRWTQMDDEGKVVDDEDGAGRD